MSCVIFSDSRWETVKRPVVLQRAVSASVSYSQVNVTKLLNLLKPTGHVMHQQFNIQQLYALPTLYLCVLYLSENKQRLVPLIRGLEL